MSEQNRNIAFIGAGRIGSGIAANLARAGHNTVVWNRTVNSVGASYAISKGCRVACSIQEAVETADIVMSCVSDVPDVEQVLSAPGGAATYAREGTLFVDFSTIGPDAATRLRDRLAERGLRFIDAPVTGGDQGARDGKLTILVGGNPSDFEEARPLLASVATNVVHCGPLGAGQAMKLVNQQLCAVHMVAMCEAFTLARRYHLDASAVVKACSTGAGSSWALQNLGPRAIEGDFASGFSIALMQKDLRLIRASDCCLPGNILADKLFSMAARKCPEGLQAATQAMLIAYLGDSIAFELDVRQQGAIEYPG